MGPRRLIGASVVVGLLVLPVWFGLTRRDVTETCEWRVGFMGALSEDYAHIGRGVRDALEEALSQHPGTFRCEVTLESLDTVGLPRVAKSLAEEMIERDPIVVFGPLFRYEAEKAWPRLLRARVPVLSPAAFADRPARSHTGWFRYLPLRDHEVEALADYIGSVTEGRIAITATYISTAREGMHSIKDALAGHEVVGPIWISGDESSGEEVAARQVNAADPDTILFMGDPDTGAFLLRSLKLHGGRSRFITDELMLPEYLPEHGPLDNGVGPGATDHEERFRRIGALRYLFKRSEGEVAGTVTSSTWLRDGDDPVMYGPETKDVAQLLLSILQEYQGDPADTEGVRDHIVSALSAGRHEGTARDYAWHENGELVADSGDIWFYSWTRSGEIFQWRACAGPEPHLRSCDPSVSFSQSEHAAGTYFSRLAGSGGFVTNRSWSSLRSDRCFPMEAAFPRRCGLAATSGSSS